MNKAQFTLSIAAIQVTIMEKFGYEISYKKTLVGKHKTLTNLFGDFHRVVTFLHGLKHANLRCVVTYKTFYSNMKNTKIFQHVFRVFHASIEGFDHCLPILSIDGTHLYGNIKPR